MNIPLKWMVLVLLLYLLPISVLAQPSPSDFGDIDLPYRSGDAGMVAIQAGDKVTVTWNNPPPDALLYIIVWKSITEDQSWFIMGIDTQSEDGVSIIWKIPEYLAGKPYGVAFYKDGTRRFSKITPLDYGSGEAPPAGICSIGIVGLSGSSEIFSNQPDGGSMIILGYLSGYARVLGREVDADGFPWLKIDLTSSGVINPLDNTLTMPDIGWIYANNIHLTGDCSFLD
ncbi:MAG: hypothetical protein GC179_20165 [Anaerolineaceae bacterium]|nr:hypothetical protein [Anaerolineaceae bacterium]